MLTVMDAFIRQALAVHVGAKRGSTDVHEVLYPLIIDCAKPEHIRSNIGPEVISEASKHGSSQLVLNPYTSIQVARGRMDTMKGSMAPVVMKF